jgi:hypothetical protein
MFEIPVNDADDALLSYFDNAWSNVTERSSQFGYGLLRAIDALHVRVQSDWGVPEDEAHLAMLAFRAHSAYRTAAQLALAGQLPEAYMVIRGALESALYAIHLSVHPEMYFVWLARVRDAVGRKGCRNEFVYGNIKRSLEARDSALARQVGELYERTIDYGAHPNVASVLGSLRIEDCGHLGESYNMCYLAGDGDEYELAWRDVARAGLLIIDMFASVFPDHWQATRVLEFAGPLRRPL